MVRKIFTFLFLLSSLSVLSQVEYQPGYFIDNSDKKIECLIKDSDWLRNPNEFKYKTSSEGALQTASIADVKEFSVNGNVYIRFKVEIDKSSTNLKKLSINRNPEWAEETLFLKQIVKGKADLYYYRANGQDYFFYGSEDRPVRQLIYKVYLVNSTETAKNNTFQNQIKADVNCLKISDARLQSLKYEMKALEKHFKESNTCSGNFYEEKKSDKKSVLHLKITPGIDFAKLDIENAKRTTLADFPRESGFRLGAEFENILPFNRGKWSVIVEPTFQAYKAKSGAQYVDYKSIEIPFGVRHYFFLGDDLSLFVNGAVVVDFPFDYKINLGRNTFESNLFRINFDAGFGVQWKKFSLEGRYYFVRTGQYEHATAFFDYNKYSAILGYRVF